MKFTAEYRLTSAAILAVWLVSSASASFEPLPVGGRAAGMSEAYSAIVDDVFALYYNPAGVMQVTRPEIGTYYSQLYPGLTDSSKINRMFLGYAQPFGKAGRLGGIGASYMSLQLSGLYKEEAFGLTYGREYHHRWNYGVSLKMLKKTIGSDEYTDNAIDPTTGAAFGGPDPVLAKGRSASGFGLDLGAQYRLSQAYALGFAARNINAPDLGIDSTDKVPSVLTLALARRLRAGSLDLEVTKWKGATDNTRVALGGEKWFKNGFGVRAGGASGAGGSATVSAGGSFRLDSFQFDYAWIYPLQGIEGTLGIQQVSLTARLGKVPTDPIELQLIKEKEERIRAETEARLARAETDRLKKQILELTDQKSRESLQSERRAAQRALDEAQMQESREQRVVRRDVLNRHTAAIADYNARVTKGISLTEKRRLLEKIQTDFADKEVDLATVSRELANLKDDEVKARKDFELSMSFYARLVQQGASVEERRSMLERIIQKYKDSGVDISAAETGMKEIK